MREMRRERRKEERYCHTPCYRRDSVNKATASEEGQDKRAGRRDMVRFQTGGMAEKRVRPTAIWR